MYYTVYKITNRINGRYYIGYHATDDLNDGYFGSGVILKQAVAKYGKENFEKQILHVFDTYAEMTAKEAELVEHNNELTYNLAPGGVGGIGQLAVRKGMKHNAEAKEKMRAAKLGKKTWNTGMKMNDDFRQKAANRQSKSWLVTFPNGTEQVINNLKQFCREHNLDNASLHDVANGKRKQHKGFSCTHLP